MALTREMWFKTWSIWFFDLFWFDEQQLFFYFDEIIHYTLSFSKDKHWLSLKQLRFAKPIPVALTENIFHKSPSYVFRCLSPVVLSFTTLDKIFGKILKNLFKLDKSRKLRHLLLRNLLLLFPKSFWREDWKLSCASTSFWDF